MASASELSRSIAEFLSNARVPQVRHCRDCGSLMGHVPVIFHFAGQDFDVALPVCPICKPECAEQTARRRVA